MGQRGAPDSALNHVIKQIESQLLDPALRPGARLPSERAMAEAFSASRSTVREAVARLVARGTLETRRGAGVFVSAAPQMMHDSLWLQRGAEGAPQRKETLEFREIFECCVARFAAERASADEHERLGAVLRDMNRAVSTGDVEAEARSDANFHLTLAAMAHNFMLTRFYTTVIDQLRDHITRNTYAAMLDLPHAKERSIARLAQHESIYRAICERAPDGAAHAMAQHLSFVGEQFSA
ncbi:FadR/GntR family transcriptional regulator [Paraburkholderia rhizosphaerae]|uniref:Pyruvate dehydrogenase complex repressor n=1 Tax=Paraburkholderia rhizosphaerae TaxID=480658 RepID=A0A4R8LVV0_9BURK|nr:FadR/GntR family transcriptional regulator [Paraburkholderia rhizosphaerae]TDY51959.1 GntR family transcriptional regulator [Paraburkholderia rhizosphaerae]